MCCSRPFALLDIDTKPAPQRLHFCARFALIPGPVTRTLGLGSACSHRGSIQPVSWKLIFVSPSEFPASLGSVAFRFAFTLPKGICLLSCAAQLPLMGMEVVTGWLRAAALCWSGDALAAGVWGPGKSV